MGKKKRYMMNPQKFGQKHFEILDNMDGKDDNIISNSRVPKTFRTLGLRDNLDQTISVSAQLFGSCSLDSKVILTVRTTGGVLLDSHVVSAEQPAIASSGSGANAGFLFKTTIPALQRADGKPFVFPEGRVRVLAELSGSTHISKIEGVTVKARSLSLSASQLVDILKTGASGAGKVYLYTADGVSGSFAPQHGSGSGTHDSDNYQYYSSKASPGGPGHAWRVAISGTVTGSIANLSLLGGTASVANGYGDDEVLLISSASAAAMDPQTLTVTYFPLDVNGEDTMAPGGGSQSISTSFTVPFPLDGS